MSKNVLINSLETMVPLTTKNVKHNVKRIANLPEMKKTLENDFVQLSNNISKKNGRVNIPRAAIERLFAMGMTRKEMGEILGVSATTVCRLCLQYGFWDVRARNKFKKMADEGMSLPQIAKKIGISLYVIRDSFEKYKINTIGQTALKNVTKEDIQKLIDTGYSTRRISKELGIDILTTSKLLKKYNLSTLDYNLNQAAVKYAKYPTEENKMEALNMVDDYLKILAEKEAIEDESCSYADYLQSLRLDFLEQLEMYKRSKKIPAGILESLKAHKPEEIDTVMGKGEHPVSLIDLDSIPSEKNNIQAFENADEINYIFDYLLNDDNISENAKETIKLYYGITPDGIRFSLEEIAYKIGLTRERIRQIKEKALGKIIKTVEKTPQLQNKINELI